VKIAPSPLSQSPISLNRSPNLALNPLSRVLNLIPKCIKPTA
jgi:hypothetical protein